MKWQLPSPSPPPSGAGPGTPARPPAQPWAEPQPPGHTPVPKPAAQNPQFHTCRRSPPPQLKLGISQAARWLTEQDTNRDIHEMVHLAVITQTASWRRQFQALNIFIEFDKLKAYFIDFIILAAVKWVGFFLNFCPFVNDLGSAACR
ncbi:hypothetical protein mRhiFer1_008334 [Rhinolophus ferrumequinum]|uniref:Uncharacterized protein n=1 Tax=Rhinolophus ferrumequinum TaxID=59479 RepID=A0A7J7VEA1_RHIFE|nr:hypothetical protein mRhiFer1_008334 [Rhinolophus ferrumequinum]